MIYAKYLVKEVDLFDPYNFPSITDDLDVIEASLAQAPVLRAPEMLVSFARHHSMEADWVSANPVLAGQISSKALPLANLQALFAAAHNNPGFLLSLEQYILNRFRPSAPASGHQARI